MKASRVRNQVEHVRREKKNLENTNKERKQKLRRVKKSKFDGNVRYEPASTLFCCKMKIF